MTFPHGQIAHVEGWQPVEGGREKDGRALLLAKGFYDKWVTHNILRIASG